ncbi:type IV toxin-antitoxin system AbiEi family antitoxin domain-containing protein [Anaerorhabdus sp.]|uniref:type IV toxin-antitoxin system AbiEi family antitoxin domain-containing protein n=1 Tax=Anaerorhabdus sp. TaxID=1872524 RepID=UPI002FCBF64A
MSKINNLIDYAKKKKVFSAQDVIGEGFSRSTLKQAVDKGLIIRWGVGSYSLEGTAPEDYFEIQRRHPSFIFSNETALYLHSLTDVAFSKYSVTVPTGYNMKSNKQFKAYYSKNEIYSLGIEEIVSPFGNVIRVYNIDKTICDVIKNENRIESQIFSQAILYYADNNKKNLTRAIKYAKIMGIEKKLKSYLRVIQER